MKYNDVDDGMYDGASGLNVIHLYGSFSVQIYECIYKYPPCRRDEMKRSFLLQEGIFVYSRVFVQ